MSVTKLAYADTQRFSKLILQYVENHSNVRPFFNNKPAIAGFKKQLLEKRTNFKGSIKKRKTLVTVLKTQYRTLSSSEKTSNNIAALSSEKTFTVTTGHQLNLCTGPLYFLYKICTTINTCALLTKEFPTHTFVPLYWMATEDHDFEEIQFFNHKETQYRWESEQQGAVGRFHTTGIIPSLEGFFKSLGTSQYAEELKTLFTDVYGKHKTLAAATQALVNTLFGEEGLVVLDADTTALKASFAPYMEEELLHQTAFKAITNTNRSLEKFGKIQVQPRALNLFYLKEGLRERIVKEGSLFKVLNTEISFSEVAIKKELESFPERFSPNVCMRPLYQEVILPNLAYVGGGGELAYWLQLKNYFQASNVVFPILLLRNSVQILSEKQQQKLNKLQIRPEELFLKQDELLQRKIKEQAAIPMDFSPQKAALEIQFSALRKLATQTDASFEGAVNAQEKKQLNGLENLEKRLLRAEKKKQQEYVQRIVQLQNELLPNGGLEERHRNFTDYYGIHGRSFITTLLRNTHPLETTFTLLEL